MYIYTPRAVSALLLKPLIRLVPTGSGQRVEISSLADLRSLLAESVEIPPQVFQDAAFEPSLESCGDFFNLLDGQGLRDLSVRDMYVDLTFESRWPTLQAQAVNWRDHCAAWDTITASLPFKREHERQVDALSADTKKEDMETIMEGSLATQPSTDSESSTASLADRKSVV